MPIDTPALTDLERTDLQDSLAKHRGFLLQTLHGLTDEQARRTPTASQLCLGGIVKHVARMEARWVRFIEEGSSAIGPADQAAYEAHAASFVMLEDETLSGLVARYEDVARHTDAVLLALPSFDASHPLPEAPWFETGARWTARRVFVHIVAETAQHAGHADIIRETLDGARTMG
jgi:uncharacterized damage-inducible protein DinB